MEIYLKKIRKENVPNLVKGIDMQVQKVQRIPNKVDAKRPTSTHIIIKMPQVKDKQRNLQSSNRKVVIYLQGSFNKTVS